VPPRKLKEALENLVITCLEGEVRKIEALKLYLIDNLSPSEISGRLKMNKNTLKNYVGRMSSLYGSNVLSVVIEECYEVFLTIKPIVVWNGKEWLCLACNRRAALIYTYNHIKVKHRDLVEAYIEKLKECLVGQR